MTKEDWKEVARFNLPWLGLLLVVLAILAVDQWRNNKKQAPQPLTGPTVSVHTTGPAGRAAPR